MNWYEALARVLLTAGAALLLLGIIVLLLGKLPLLGHLPGDIVIHRGGCTLFVPLLTSLLLSLLLTAVLNIIAWLLRR